MSHRLSLLAALALLLLAAACTKDAPKVSPGANPSGGNKVTLKLGTYNLWTSESRKKYLSDNASASRQRYWKAASGALFSLVKEMDCDIFAFQEICDSIYGKKGNATSLRYLMEKGAPGYEWAIWSNVDGARVSTTSGSLSYSPGICYKSSVLNLEEGGVFWLGGNPSAPEFAKTTDFNPTMGDPKRACVWAKMRHKASGKVFYFLSAHLDTRSFSGTSYPMVNEANCKNLMAHADQVIVPQGVPSVIAGDMNTKPGETGFDLYLNKNEGRIHKWRNAYTYALGMNVLGPNAKANAGTTNGSVNETDATARIDHLFLDGFSISSYEVQRKKFRTADGSLHYPSDHHPLTVTVSF